MGWKRFSARSLRAIFRRVTRSSRLGDEGDELFLIVNGKVRVWTGSGPAISERTLTVLGPGEHFGEASMLSRGKRTATVTALTYVETLVLGGDDYRRLLGATPAIAGEYFSFADATSVGNERRDNDSETASTRRSLAGHGDRRSVGWSLAAALVVSFDGAIASSSRS